MGVTTAQNVLLCVISVERASLGSQATVAGRMSATIATTTFEENTTIKKKDAKLAQQQSVWKTGVTFVPYFNLILLKEI